MADRNQQIKAAQRLEVVIAYLYGTITPKEFTDLFNTEKVFKTLHKKTGDIDTEELFKWVCGCYKVVSDE